MSKLKILPKRTRRNPTHRWNVVETTCLLKTINVMIKGQPDRFENPTARLFYKEVFAISRNQVLASLGWYLVKNKMRNLRTLYLKAREWKESVGVELTKQGREEAVKSYIYRVCEYYDLLDQIFGSRVETDTKSILDNVTEDDNTESIDNSDLFIKEEFTRTLANLNRIDDTNEIYELESLDDFDMAGENSLPSESIVEENVNAAGVVDSLPKSEASKMKSACNGGKARKLGKRTFKRSFKSFLYYMTEMEEKRLRLEELKMKSDRRQHAELLRVEREKLQLKKEKMSQEAEFKFRQLEREMELKKLQLEKEERLQRLELEMKYKFTK